jgi:hypothetical protein
MFERVIADDQVEAGIVERQSLTLAEHSRVLSRRERSGSSERVYIFIDRDGRAGKPRHREASGTGGDIQHPLTGRQFCKPLVHAPILAHQSASASSQTRDSGFRRVDVDGHGVLDVKRVATREHHRNRYRVFFRQVEHHAIPLY